MRATIEHREEASGVSGAGREYFVDCTLQFSEEEKAIIRARDLYANVVQLPAATAPPTLPSLFGTGAMRGGGPLLAMAGVVLLFFAGGLGTLLIFGGIGLAAHGWWKGWQQDRRLGDPNQAITFRRLLSEPRFTVHAPNPAVAKLIEEEIRAQLTSMKALLRESAELNRRQSFEL